MRNTACCKLPTVASKSLTSYAALCTDHAIDDPWLPTVDNLEHWRRDARPHAGTKVLSQFVFAMRLVVRDRTFAGTVFPSPLSICLKSNLPPFYHP